MYPQRWYYYMASLLDLILRFLWIYSLIPPDANIGERAGIHSLDTFLHWLSPVSMFLEMARRTIWGFFRLENEQLRNTEGYRRVKFVPLHFDHTEEQLQTQGKNVVLEVVVFGASVVIVGAIALLASRQVAENGGGGGEDYDDDDDDDAERRYRHMAL
jgi:hypothetical protein